MKKEQYIDLDGKILEIERDTYETKIYYNSEGQFHRLDGPAIKYQDGDYDWYKNGKLHRIGGPAYFNKYNNYYEWYINGQRVNIYYICG